MRGLAEAGECLRTRTAAKPSSTRLLAGPGNGVDAGAESARDLAAPPSFAPLRGIGFQQNAGLGQLSGRVLTRMDQRVELLPLLIVELYHVPLLGSLFRGHEASPSLRS